MIGGYTATDHRCQCYMKGRKSQVQHFILACTLHVVNGNRRYRCTERPGNHSNLMQCIFWYLWERHLSNIPWQRGVLQPSALWKWWLKLVSWKDSDMDVSQLNSSMCTDELSTVITTWLSHYDTLQLLLLLLSSVTETWVPQGSMKKIKPTPNPLPTFHFTAHLFYFCTKTGISPLLGTGFYNLKPLSLPLLNIKDNFSIFMQMNFCLHVYLCTRCRPGSCGGQEGTAELLELALQMVWGLGTKPWFSRRAVGAHNCWATSLASQSPFLVTQVIVALTWAFHHWRNM